MKILAPLFWLLSALVLPAASVGLAWDDPNPPGEVEGYLIYWRTNGGTYSITRTVACGTNSGVVSNLNLGTTYFFVVTATNGALESGWSNELTVDIPRRPDPPTNLRTNELRLKAQLLNAHFPEGPWELAYNWPDVTIPNDINHRFYKVQLELSRE